LLIAAGAAYFFHARTRRPDIDQEVAYVLARKLDVVDTTAEIRLTVATLRAGDRVGVLEHTTHWIKIRLPNGKTGWVENKDMLDQETYQRAQRLLKELSSLSPQSAGHVTELVNLRLEPARDGPVLGQLDVNQKVDIFGRRLVARPAASDQPNPPSPSAGKAVREAWYLVRSSSSAGWVVGRVVELDVPPGILPYAQGFNMVGWLVVTTVDDGGRQMPEYLAVDRLGSPDVDFNHLRVFTWWKKRQQYVTAYVESGLNGFFPLRVSRSGVPIFRLRLVEEDGRKVQKVYGMYDTIVRPIGMVAGWESDAMPERQPSKSRRVRRARRRR